MLYAYHDTGFQKKRSTLHRSHGIKRGITLSAISPQQSLSFSIPANPGVYALLLGSGLSRSAGILTGSEIVRDLLGQLAHSEGQSDDIDLEDWYRRKYDREPEYSTLLDELARTPAERHRLLRPYFEPDEHERELGRKRPTDAHHAIARMAADGYIRVIITTNFDRLIETALQDAGVTPTVLSTPDQIAGALPLIHIGCCVFKVHGDYLDPRILNSPTELSSYPPELDRLLDQIFDQFGLVICGWSADWDIALCNAIARTQSRRFTTYWASPDGLGESAQRLVEHRNAQVIQIRDADTFFEEVQASVASVAEFSRPHPLSTQEAVETLKRYMVSREHRIRLTDHINSVVIRLAHAIDGDVFSTRTSVDQQTFIKRVETYEAACTTLMAMAVVAGYWAEEEHFQDWERTIRHIYNTREVGGYTVWGSLRNYPTCLLMYALGLGAVISGRMTFLRHIFDITVDRRVGGVEPTTVLTGLYSDMSSLRQPGLWPGKESHYTPFNDRLHEVLAEPCDNLMLSDGAYSLAFDTLEIFMALNVGRHRGATFGEYPIGSFLHRPANMQLALKGIRVSLHGPLDESQMALTQIFGSNMAECLQELDDFQGYVGRVALSAGIY